MTMHSFPELKSKFESFAIEFEIDLIISENSVKQNFDSLRLTRCNAMIFAINAVKLALSHKLISGLVTLTYVWTPKLPHFAFLNISNWLWAWQHMCGTFSNLKEHLSNALKLKFSHLAHVTEVGVLSWTLRCHQYPWFEMAGYETYRTWLFACRCPFFRLLISLAAQLLFTHEIPGPPVQPRRS